MSNSIDKSTDDICAICFDSFKSPVRLPCCNNQFCMKCLELWQPGLDNYVRGKRTCPYCQQLIPPTQEVVDTIKFYKRFLLTFALPWTIIATSFRFPFSKSTKIEVNLTFDDTMKRPRSFMEIWPVNSNKYMGKTFKTSSRAVHHSLNYCHALLCEHVEMAILMRSKSSSASFPFHPAA
mmetsp:Transcript_32212/g.78280  ORF Transcript_32212/g.78280 Transcript_32212/m.78280 type:complete len:179 (+) Transcript_32212:1639-2175(+)